MHQWLLHLQPTTSGEKKRNKLCICISSKFSFRLAAQQGQLFPGNIQTEKQHGADDGPIRVATGRGIVSVTANRSFLTVTHQEGNTSLFTRLLRQTRSAGPLFFWPALSAPEAIKSDMMHGGNEPICEQLTPKPLSTPTDILVFLPPSILSSIYKIVLKRASKAES